MQPDTTQAPQHASSTHERHDRARERAAVADVLAEGLLELLLSARHAASPVPMRLVRGARRDV